MIDPVENVPESELDEKARAAWCQGVESRQTWIAVKLNARTTPVTGRNRSTVCQASEAFEPRLNREVRLRRLNRIFVQTGRLVP